MNVNLSELMAALPHDHDDHSDAGEETELAHEQLQEQLKEIFADLALRPVPVHSLHRLWSTGELAVQIALAYLALRARNWFDNTEARKLRVMETNLRLALKTVHRLGYLRGAMIKVGQAAANFPDMLPGPIADTLEKLHFEAPPMHYSLIREMLANELKGDPAEVFASFDKEAFAAASLGQVHRATLKSGEAVAVKVQYPGIARTIDADFRNLAALLFPLRLGKDWESVKAHFEEIQRMLNQEVDYAQEAENLREARALFQPEDGIVVPRVYAEYSTRRVLTMEYLPGLHLKDFLTTDPSQASRNAFGTKMYTAHFRLYSANINHADPHPGNYLFLDDGRLGLLDFGCVQHFDAEERELVDLSMKLVYNRDLLPEVMRRVAHVGEKDRADPEYAGLVKEGCEWMLEPLDGGPFDFGDGRHLRAGIGWFARFVRKGCPQSHPMFLYYDRTVFGMKALLYRLRAQVDVRAVINATRFASGGRPA
jgi:aarF domain-containing kinase